MFEVAAGLQGFEVTTLEDWLLLDLIEEETHTQKQTHRRRLRLGWQFITNNRVEVASGEEHAGWDEEGLTDDVPGFVDSLGGEGTPLIHISAPVHWATASRRSVVSAKHYLANVMDLHVRYPKLHHTVETLALEVWTAFNLCEATRGPSFDCARWIDDRLAEQGRYGHKAVDVAVKTAIAQFHPDLVRDSSRLDRDDWDVQVDHNPNHTPGGGTGTSTLEAVGDSMDLTRFLDAVSDEAATAGRLGDTDTLGQRKAKALGTLADRQATLDLAGLLDIPGNDSSDAGSTVRPTVRPTVNADGDLVHPETGRTIRRKTTYGQVKVFIHLTKTDLDAFQAGDHTRHGEAGKLGPQTLGRIQDWLHTYGPDAKIQPVVDTTWSWAVDPHDPPEAMREHVTQRDRTCVFPGCSTDSRHCDLDHIIAYDTHGPRARPAPRTSRHCAGDITWSRPTAP